MTVHDYLKWAAANRVKLIASGNFSSDPEPLFSANTCDPDYWEFNPGNWNGGDILRRWLVDVWTPDTCFADYLIKYYWDSDQTTIYILGENEWFEISWYKNRGCTERIKRNGYDVELGEYIRLCNCLGITLND